MATTRPRVNLVLTQTEETALRRLTAHDSVHRRILEANQPSYRTGTVTEGRIDADLIHWVLAIGLAKLDEEAIAASYAAEAASRDPERDAAIAGLRRRHIAKAGGAAG